MDPNTPSPISPLPNFSPQSAVTTSVVPVVPATSVVADTINPDLVSDVSPSVLSAPFVPSITTPIVPPAVPEAIPIIDPIIAPVATPQVVQTTPVAPVAAPVTPVAPPPVAVVSPLVENPDDVKTIS